MAMTREVEATSDTISASPSEIAIGLLTGCQDRPYAFGLAMALASRGVSLDVIGSDEVDSPEMHSTAKLHFLNLRGSQRQDTNSAKRLSKLLIYYVRLIRYAISAEPKIFHILWNNRFEYIDRTLVMLYYKTLGKKIVLTVHNVNQARRDAKDSMLNRLTLRIQYRLADHIFVHTEAMRKELLEDFQVRGGAVTVIPFGINNAVPHTDLT
ncbi:MAG: glycosyltransferase family 4 protein, partial [Candidatus Acidiferrales bacterium]